MLTVLTLLLVLTSGQRFMPISQAPEEKQILEKQILEKNNARHVEQRDTKQQSLVKQSFMTRRSWFRATAISSAAAGMVGSVAGESVALPHNQSSNEAVLPDSAQPEGYTLARAAQSINQGAATLPALPQPSDASFSRNHLQAESFATEYAARTAQTSLITQAKDGSWTLSTEVPANSSSATQQSNTIKSQGVVSDLAKQTTRTRQACTDRSCRGLAYIESRLPKAQADVQDLQAQLDDFEAHRAQQNMEGYQKLLSDRIFEIAQQEQDLVVATQQTQQRITQLKTMLVQMDADLELAERALSLDAAYQASWQRLLQAERSLMNEFSQVNLDATELNEIYSDYEYHQQQAQLSAGEALGNYLLQAVTVPGFIQRSPGTLTFLQELTTAKHEYRLQKLRQTTIGQIQKRLSDREGQLIGDVSEYETLQRELTTAKKLVQEYETEREFILAKQAARQNAQQTVDRSATALNRAKRLAPLLPKGSVAQGVIYTVLAAGAIAAITAYRRNRRVIVPQLALQTTPAKDYTFQPTALQQANFMEAIKLPSLRFSAAQLQPEGVPSILPPTTFQESQPAQARQTGRQTVEVKGERTVAERTLTEQTAADQTLDEKLFAAAPIARLHGEDQPSAEDIFEEMEAILSGAEPAQLTSYNPDSNNLDSNNFEQRILSELMELTGQTTRMLESAPEETSSTVDDRTVDDRTVDNDRTVDGDTVDENSLTIEMMVRDLSEAIGQTTPEGSLNQEIQTRQLAPAQLSLNDVDLFAEHAVQWVLKDLGISPMATALDKAEAAAKAEMLAQASGWNAEEMAEIEAISIESLEIVQPAENRTQQANQPIYQSVRQPALGSGNREFATVAA